MSDTPRTDAAQDQIRYVGAATLEYVHADFARNLERELAAARELDRMSAVLATLESLQPPEPKQEQLL